MTTSNPSSPGLIGRLIGAFRRTPPSGKKNEREPIMFNNFNTGSMSAHGNIQIKTTNNFPLSSSTEQNNDNDKRNTEPSSNAATDYQNKNDAKTTTTTTTTTTTVLNSSAYHKDSQGNIVIPHELIPLRKKDITIQHCTNHIQYYVVFNHHPNFRSCATISESITNFKLILTTIYEEIVGEGRRLFKEEVCKNFGKMGIKFNAQPPQTFEQCMSVLGDTALKSQRYPTFPVVLAYRCVHSVTAKPEDSFYHHLRRQLAQFGKTNNLLFENTVDGTTKHEHVSPNIITIAKRGFSDPKKDCQKRETNQFNMSIRQQKKTDLTSDEMLIPMGKKEKEDGGCNCRNKCKCDEGGPYFLITSKRKLFGDQLSTQKNDVLEHAFRQSDDQRIYLQAAAMGAANGLNKQAPVSYTHLRAHET